MVKSEFDDVTYRKEIDRGNGKYFVFQMKLCSVPKEERDQIEEPLDRFIDSVSKILK